MDWTRALVLLMCLAGLVSKTSGTECDAKEANTPCVNTGTMTDDCDAAISMCKCKPGNSPIDSGCAPSGGLGQPSVDAGPYSGDVQQGKDITLTCKPDAELARYPDGVLYVWYVNGTKLVNESSDQLNYTAVLDATDDISCKMTYGENLLSSNESDPFVVTGLPDIGFTLMTQQVIVGNYEGIVIGNSLTLRCVKIPLHDLLDYQWTGGDENQDFVIHPPITSSNISCTLTDSSATIFHPSAATVTIPTEAAAATLLQGFEASITSHDDNTKFETGTDIALKCELLTNNTVLYNPDTDISYAWYDGAVLIGGQTQATLNTSSLNAGDHNISCRITPTGGSAIESIPINISAVASPIQAVRIEKYPTHPVEGHMLVLVCAVSVPSQDILDEISYTWTYDGEHIYGQYENRLQFSGVSDELHGEMKHYTCSAHYGEFEETAVFGGTNIIPVDQRKPTIEDDNRYLDYEEGEEYELFCVTVSFEGDYDKIGFTHQWYKDGNLVGSTADLKVTASSVAANYTCKATLDGVDTLVSDPFIVESGWVKKISIDGPSKPIETISATYNCLIEFYNDTLVPYTYSLLDNGVEVSDNATYLIPSVSNSFSALYNCKFNVYGKNYTLEDWDRLFVTSTGVPEVPRISANFNWRFGYINGIALLGEPLELNCLSGSAGSGTSLSYEWYFTPSAGVKAQHPESGPTLRVNSTSMNDTGQYTCKAIISALPTAESSPLVVTVEAKEDQQGAPCDENSFPYMCGTHYYGGILTGHCVAGACQCLEGEQKNFICGEYESEIQPSSSLDYNMSMSMNYTDMGDFDMTYSMNHTDMDMSYSYEMNHTMDMTMSYDMNSMDPSEMYSYNHSMDMTGVMPSEMMTGSMQMSGDMKSMGMNDTIMPSGDMMMSSFFMNGSMMDMNKTMDMMSMGMNDTIMPSGMMMSSDNVSKMMDMNRTMDMNFSMDQTVMMSDANIRPSSVEMMMSSTAAPAVPPTEGPTVKPTTTTKKPVVFSCNAPAAYPFGAANGDTRVAPSGEFGSPSTTEIRFKKKMPVGTKKFKRITISQSGYVTFGRKGGNFGWPNLEYFGGIGISILAPFWSEVNTANGVVWYRYLRHKDDAVSSAAVFGQTNNEVNAFLARQSPNAERFSANEILIVTWDKVRPQTWYDQECTGALAAAPVCQGLPTEEDSFQLILSTDGERSFARFVYLAGQMNWEYEQNRLIAVGIATNSRIQDMGFFNNPKSTEMDTLRWHGEDCPGTMMFQVGSGAKSQSACNAFLEANANFLTANSANINALPSCPCLLGATEFFQWEFYSYDVQSGVQTICLAVSQPAKFFQELDGNKLNRLCCYESKLITRNPGESRRAFHDRQWFNLFASSLIPDREPGAGFLLTVQPWRWARDYKASIENDFDPKKACCEDHSSQDCLDFFAIRSVGTCNPVIPFFSAFGFGDPHVTTLDGFYYPMNGLGEYILFTSSRTNGANLETMMLQGRTGIASTAAGNATTATVYTAFAMKQDVGGTEARGQVELVGDASMKITVNGVEITNAFYGDTSYTRSESGLTVSRDDTSESEPRVVYAFTSGLSVKIHKGVRSLEIEVNADIALRTIPRGLLGNFDGDKNNDFIKQGETVALSNTTSERLLWSDFAASWLVTSSDTVFNYDTGKNTLSYQDASFVPTFLDEANQTLVTEAQATCGDDIACVYDLVVTGDETVANYTLASSGQAVTVQNTENNANPTIGVKAGDLNADGQWSVTHGATETLTVEGTDADNDAITYVLVGSPSGVSIDGTTGVITYNVNEKVPVTIKAQSKDTNEGYSPEIVIPVVVCPDCSSPNGTCTSTLRDESFENGNFQLYECNCTALYDGDDCEDIFDACALRPCGIERNCTNKAITDDPTNPTRYTCDPCPTGYVDSQDVCVDTNECANTTHPVCGSNANCTNTVGSFECTCDDGYRLNSAVLTQCDDINECAEGLAGCQHDCVNTDGSYNCTCRDGYVLNADMKSCDVSALDAACTAKGCDSTLGYCEMINGTATCGCNTGYQVQAADDTKCEDRDECTDGTYCSQGCTNSVGGFTCSCFTGFKLDTDGRTCISCPSPTWGDNCANTCQCNGQGTCDPVRGCVCNAEWTGDDCTEDVDECQTPNICGADKVCSNRTNGYDCLCRTGYELDANNDCVDVDECTSVALNGCDFSLETCENNPGSFQCKCITGYIKNAAGTCEDIDECAAGTSGCSQSCSNTVGGFNCACYVGFLLEADLKTCKQSSDVCAGSSLNCSNICTLDSSTSQPVCTCEPGFQLGADQQTCEDINECDVKYEFLNLCSNKDTCVNTNGGYDCNCPIGFLLANDNRTCEACGTGKWGDNCATDCNCTAGADRCDAAKGCICTAGWTGEFCHEDVDQCASGAVQCPAREVCKTYPGPDLCECITGYARDGSNVCQDVDECTAGTDNCAHTCTNTAGSFECSCFSGYELKGSACQDLDECTLDVDTCQDVCVNTAGGFKCDCSAGFLINSDGITCRPEAECPANNSCDALAQCAVIGGVSTCLCPGGYELNNDNVTCDDIDLCKANPCGANSVCAEAPGNTSVQCGCNPGYKLDSTGFACQECVDGFFGDCTQACTCNAANTDNCNKVNGTCTCKTGYEGNDCNDDKNECTDDPTICDSKPNSFCTNVPGSHVCECPLGYFTSGGGTACTACSQGDWGKECANKCLCTSNAASCNATDGTCTCKEGWMGATCNEDINECGSANNCTTSGIANYVCYNNDGSYSCDCSSGYTFSNNTCQNVDECSISSLNLCQDNCTDTPGNFTCSCRTGYIADPSDRFKCIDNNECLVAGTCSQVCTNTDTSFTCSCNSGFMVNPTDTKACLTSVSRTFGVTLDFATNCSLTEINAPCYIELKDNVTAALLAEFLAKSTATNIIVTVTSMRRGSVISEAEVQVDSETDPLAASHIVDALVDIAESGLVIDGTTYNSLSVTITETGQTTTITASSDKCEILLLVTNCTNGCQVVDNKALCIESDDDDDDDIPLIVGLCVGIPLGLLLIAGIVYLVYTYSKKREQRRVDSRVGHYNENVLETGSMHSIDPEKVGRKPGTHGMPEPSQPADRSPTNLSNTSDDTKSLVKVDKN